MTLAVGILGLFFTIAVTLTIPPLLLGYAVGLPYLKALALTVAAGWIVGLGGK